MFRSKVQILAFLAILPAVLCFSFVPASLSTAKCSRSNYATRSLNMLLTLEKEESFDDKIMGEAGLASSGPVLVDFWATWCGPCKLIEPILNDVQTTYPSLQIIKVNADEHKQAVKDYKVTGLPLLMVVKEGKVVAKHEGVIAKPKLVKFLEKKGGLSPEA
uniref:Thioredoxin domain-containing protein n=1 Tax=Fibrocapsa japonica TaxID=94617 RepID=A0A7S2V6I0_9STRA|mmetsp:Transcript_8776/g.13501  ORF Transcript_8776/g.13501 Transcript_8776/m.13501 type:complete len:161 (+) Transcript_8776:47-529(+)